MTEPRTFPTDSNVTTAAQWIAANEPRADVVPEVKRRYGLTSLQAAEACALAQKFRASRRAFG